MANDDKVIVKKEKQGFLSKIGNSFAGIPIGILLIIIGILVLGNNEKTNVKNIKSVKELRNQVVDIASDKVDSKNEGKLVALYGDLDYGNSPVVDQDFNLSAKYPKLKRIVEVYQWIETSDESKDKVTYSYSKDWSEKVINSDDFNTSKGHENPKVKPYDSMTFSVDSNLKVGEFTLVESFKDQLLTNTNYINYEEVTLPLHYTVNNKYITNSADLENPEVGDVRISYKIADYRKVSILGKQVGSNIEAYSTKNNNTYAKLYKGTLNSTQIINNIEKSNNSAKWVKRILGSALIIFGVSLILGPVTALIGYIPFVGEIVNSMIGVLSFLVGLIISLLVIAISWFIARPLVSIILLVVIAGLIFAIVYFVKKNKTVKEEK